MDSDALLTFLTIHRTGGFSRAADQLGRTQPAISRRLALLEEGLGMPLFDRGREGVSLSQAGQVLLPYAEQVVAVLSDASQAMDAFSSKKTGPVSIAAVGTLAGTPLTGVLKRFSRVYPKVDLSLRTATSDEVSDLVRQGEVSIGLRYFEDASPGLVNHVIGSERLQVVCSADHRLAGKKVKSLRDLSGERWLAFPNHFERRDASAENLFAQFLVRDVPSIDWSPIDSLTAQKRLAEAGFGLGFLPESSIQEELRAGTLLRISVADLDAGNPVVAVVRHGGYLSPAGKELLGILRDGLDFAA